ncbi:MinD/ParA family protein [Marinobacter halodurans]|uniref:MinD/ParA family protein n=1 Tax=Marinobacter halodurans TaxID=2528979 RepID=A0ABY1ZN16_9GAMM|nr:AAA family ATPase [Marinobacter halodurans]TBW57889.1 MinD/ParA family protein [Marinobacter halodurans]
MAGHTESSTASPRILAVTGGKGGVGKTSVALNLALILARQGSRVLLLDGDTDLANVTIMLGQSPGKTLEHVLANECTLEEAIFEAPFGLHILPGASGVERCIGIAPSDRLAIFRGLASLEKRYDYILIDTAAGLQANVMHMIASASLACVVVTPDPTSLTDAFSLLKVLKRRGYRRTPSILINMARGASQAQSIFQRFYAAAQRHLDISPHYMGAIWRDETLRHAVATQRPVATLPESDPSCRQFRVLADMVKVRFERIEPRRSGFSAYWNRLAERRNPVSAKAEPAPRQPADVPTRWREWTRELDELLSASETSPIQRYEALTSCFAQFGRTMDEDTIEIIQTGLAAMAWERLPEAQRAHFAAHLRHLAGEIEPQPSTPAPMVSRERQEPRYDEIRFGSQDALLRALRDQPSDVSLDAWLDSISSSDRRKK